MVTGQQPSAVASHTCCISGQLYCRLLATFDCVKSVDNKTAIKLLIMIRTFESVPDIVRNFSNRRFSDFLSKRCVIFVHLVESDFRDFFGGINCRYYNFIVCAIRRWSTCDGFCIQVNWCKRSFLSLRRINRNYLFCYSCGSFDAAAFSWCWTLWKLW